MGVQLICRIFFTETLRKFHKFRLISISRCFHSGEVHVIRKKRECRQSFCMGSQKTIVGGQRYGR
jgi:hypothetical protein